jgi:hypothetical protein
MCYIEAKTTVRIREGAGTRYRTVGRLHRGQTLQASCHPTSGQWYGDCGGSYWWISVYYHGWWRYVALACVDFYYDEHEAVEDREAVEAVRAETRESTVPPAPEPAPAAEG